jgi:hypothetical protein
MNTVNGLEYVNIYELGQREHFWYFAVATCYGVTMCVYVYVFKTHSVNHGH